jgi:hypothetical protein
MEHGIDLLSWNKTQLDRSENSLAFTESDIRAKAGKMSNVQCAMCNVQSGTSKENVQTPTGRPDSRRPFSCAGRFERLSSALFTCSSKLLSLRKNAPVRLVHHLGIAGVRTSQRRYYWRRWAQFPLWRSSASLELTYPPGKETSPPRIGPPSSAPPTSR